MKKRDKRFLNESTEEFGSISWSVVSGDPVNRWDSLVESDLRISNCSKNIHLDFNCEKLSHIDKRLVKLDNLIDSLTLFKEALLEAKKEVKSKNKFYY